MEEGAKEIPLLTFNSLYNVLRGEKRIKSLQKLPESFYEALEKFIFDKKAEIERLKKNQSQDQLRKEMHVLKNSHKISLELLNLRCVKISNIAVKNKLFDNETLSEDNILEKEKEFYDSVQKSVQKISKIL